MNLTEYATYDALGLAELVAKKQVSPKELAQTAVAAKEKVDPAVRSVVEIYDDQIDDLDEARLGNGPFRGVPFLIKDVFGHLKGRKIEFGSRLCEGMIGDVETNFAKLSRPRGSTSSGAPIRPNTRSPRQPRTPLRQHAQSLETRVLGRRLYGRWRGGGRVRHGAGGAWLRHRRLDPHPGELVWRRWFEALARAHLLRPLGR